MTTVLKGITWNHTRGYLPMAATAQRYSELHPEIEILWQKRSLQEFADFPLDKLVEQFDLLVVDHPFVGQAAAQAVLLPLDEHLPAHVLEDQRLNSVGSSHESYCYGGRQWALAIDAATQVSSWRPDLLESAGAAVPQTWEEVLELARRGLATVPAIPIDSLACFFALCHGLGEEPFSVPGRMISEETGAAALQCLRQLAMLCGPECFERNPIRTYEAMIAEDRVGYCPLAYGYSNYARPHYARRPLHFGPPVAIGGRRLRTMLGGAGLAISARCRFAGVALDYARFVAGAECQRGLYFASGGQPGHRTAWLDPENNRVCNNYFLDTLPALQEAWLRPRHPGYLRFQDHAGLAIQRYLREGGDAPGVLRELGELSTL